MIYSVFNTDGQCFDYYESSKQQTKQNVEAPSITPTSKALGATIDDAAWPLPADARFIGSGDQAVGRIAARPRARALGDVTDNIDLVKAGLLAGAAYLLWKYVVKSPRRRHA